MKRKKVSTYPRQTLENSLKEASKASNALIQEHSILPADGEPFKDSGSLGRDAEDLLIEQDFSEDGSLDHRVSHDEESENLVMLPEIPVLLEEGSQGKELLPLENLKEPKEKSVSSDLLKTYLYQFKKIPVLEAEEEFALATKLKNEGDLNAAKALVSANLRLVVKIAYEYKNFYSNFLDLIQEGNIGLMKAVSRFEPARGVRLSYYASWWIRSYILKYLLDNFRLVRLGKTQAQKKLFYHLVREKEKLENQGVLAGPKLLAQNLNVKEKEIVEMQQRLSSQGSEVSLDVTVDSSDDSKSSYKDILRDPREGAEESLMHRQLLEVLKKNLGPFQKTLSEKELKILQERMLANEPKTLQEVADQYGLTRERARQIEAKVIEKLKNFLAPWFK